MVLRVDNRTMTWLTCHRQQEKWLTRHFSWRMFVAMKLDLFRVSKSMSYKSLADLLNLDIGHTRRLCLGEIKPTLGTIRKIAAATSRTVTVKDWT